MPAVRTALRRPAAVFASHDVRALVGFCLLGTRVPGTYAFKEHLDTLFL